METTNKAPKMIDLDLYRQAGIDPKTGLPLKAGAGMPCTLKDDTKKLLRIIDEQNAVNRYVWYNLPAELTSQELERLLYYKGQLAFFFLDDKFYFMPYALSGGIDFYGRFKTIHPIPFSDGTDKETARQRTLLSTINLDVAYDVPDLFTELDPTKTCVLLYDYTKQLSQTIIARKDLQEPILDVMANCIPYANTAAMNSTGVMGMKVSGEDEAANVEIASKAVQNAALTGRKYIPMIGGVDFQELAGQNLADIEQFMIFMQSLDNFRLSTYGLDNGGLFQKKAHMLEAEQEMNGGNIGLIIQDGLSIRQNFCNIANSIFGTSIWCEVSETVAGLDKNMDGEISDEQDGQEPIDNEGGTANE